MNYLAAHAVGCSVLRGNFGTKFTLLSGVLNRPVLITRYQMNFHWKVVDVGHEDLPFRVKCATAPIHPAEVAGKSDGALHTRG
jgi:hypothetical protein